MYKREVFDKVGLLNEDMPPFEDYEFHLRCLSAGLKIGYVDKIVSYYRIHERQLTAQKFNSTDAAWKEKREAMRKGYEKP